MELDAEQALRWYLEAGVDETIGEVPIDRFAAVRPSPAGQPIPAPPISSSARPASAAPSLPGMRPSAPVAGDATSAQLAQACNSVEELKAAVEAYDGCNLKKTAGKTVFADGDPKAKLMLIGEAPGSDEDRMGLPFVGVSGKLLDKMLAAIGLDRSGAYITNVIFWRPPGNRKPEPGEVALCLPFLARHIELVDPQVLMFLGGAAAAALLGRTDSITRLRGQWQDYSSIGLSRPIPAMPTYHPAYLLRTPQHKKEAWRDFLAVRKRLSSAI